MEGEGGGEEKREDRGMKERGRERSKDKGTEETHETDRKDNAKGN